MIKIRKCISLVLLMVIVFSSSISYGDTKSVTDNSKEILKSKYTNNKNSMGKKIDDSIRVYLDGQNGNDENNGETQELGVKTFNRAVDLIGLNNEGNIVITSKLDITTEENWNEGGATKKIVVDENYKFEDIQAIINVKDTKLTINNIVFDGEMASKIYANDNSWKNIEIINVQGDNSNNSSELVLKDSKIENFSTEKFIDKKDDKDFSVIISVKDAMLHMDKTNVSNNKGKNGIISINGEHPLGDIALIKLSNIENSEIMDNKGDESGAVVAKGLVKVNLKNTIIDNNSINREEDTTKSTAAGLMVLESAEVVMDGGSISGNKNTIKEGYGYLTKITGGVFIGSTLISDMNSIPTTTFILNSGEISNNEGSTVGGVSIAGLTGNTRRISYEEEYTSPILGKFIMNNGELKGNTALGYKIKTAIGSEELSKAGSGGGINVDSGIVKILGGEIKDNNAKGISTGFYSTDHPDYPGPYPVSMKFPRGNGIYLGNSGVKTNTNDGTSELQLGGNGLYIGGSPKINKNNDIFLDNFSLFNSEKSYFQTFIQIEDSYNGDSKENQIKLTTPINWKVSTDSDHENYKLVTKPIVEPEENVENMGTTLVDYSAAGGISEAKDAQDKKYFAVSEYMNSENGYDGKIYPEYKDGFRVYQSKFKGGENFLVYGVGSEDIEEPTDPTKPTDPETPVGKIKEITLVGGKDTLTENIEKQLKDFSLDRLHGKDRYGTSAKVSREYGKKDTVILASGEKYTDELTASVLASKMDIPILLTMKNFIPESVLREIERPEAKKVIIIGGDETISRKLEQKLSKDYITERIGGPDRYDTSILIGGRIRELTDKTDEAILVDGTNFPDAIAMTSMGVENSIPILLTNPKELTASTAKSI